jgi:hypothetical protein
MALDAYMCVVEINMDITWRIFWHWTLYCIRQFHNLGKANNCLNQTFICFVDFPIPSCNAPINDSKVFLGLVTFNSQSWILSLVFCQLMLWFFSFLLSSTLPLLVVNVFFWLMF